MNREVVVSGVGVVSPLGIGKKVFWNNLVQGKSGISEITAFDTTAFSRHRGGQIHDFVASQYVDDRRINFMGRASQMAVVATQQALKDAKIEQGTDNIAVAIGVTLPEGSEIDASSHRLLTGKTNDIPVRSYLNMFGPAIARNVGYIFGFENRNILIPCACAAGNYAISQGFDEIRNGEVDCAVVGGAESFSRIAFQGFHRLHVMAPEFCTPFDKNRKGMMLGEGAGILVLEEKRRAIARHAPIYANVLGYGLSCDASHPTVPKKEGIMKAMSKALRQAGVMTRDIDYINAHGTGTPANDKTESQAIHGVFGRYARKVMVSSIKSMLGHCMGAASSIEAIACSMALRYHIVPPTMNFQTPDPECDIDCVPNSARRTRLRVVLNNGFAFGGNNCCVVFGEID